MIMSKQKKATRSISSDMILIKAPQEMRYNCRNQNSQPEEEAL